VPDEEGLVVSARAALIDAATLTVATERRAKGCTHVRRCGCVGKWRVTALVVVAALLDAGWTISPPKALCCVDGCPFRAEDDSSYCARHGVSWGREKGSL
jgi:hypothetical protein